MSTVDADLIDVLDSIDEYISSFDKDWNILYISKKTANDFGCKQSELTGKNFWQLFPKFIGTELEKNYRNVMEKRVTIKFEWRTIYVKESVREFAVSPSVHGITVYGIDITERKKAEKALQRSNQNIHDMLNSIKDNFYVLDKSWNFVYINEPSAKTIGKTPEELIGKSIWEMYPKMLGTPVEQNYRIAMECRVETRFEMQGRYREKTYQITAYPSSEGIIAIGTDISEIKKTEIELLQRTEELEKTQTKLEEIAVAVEEYANQMEELANERAKQLQEQERMVAIGQTAGMVGHDIRNPLQAITGDVYLLKDYLLAMPETPTKRDVAESLEEIEKNIGYINKIVADLQDYSKVIRPELKELNLYDLVINVFRAIVIPENVNPSLDIDPRINLKTDPTLFTRILTNLVINAFQAMPNGGDLSIVATKKQDAVVFSVGDTGVGIPEFVKPKLFTPMMTTKAKGQGLGLAVVKRLVEALKGAIIFESQEGKGTTFKIELPLNS